MNKQHKVPLGIWMIIGFFVICIIIWVVGQGGAVVAYDTVAAYGLQDSRASVDPVLVEVNRGIAFADVAVQLPFFVLAIIGLWRLKFYGAVAAWVALGIHMYWITVAWAKQYFYIQAGVKCVPIATSLNVAMVFFFLFSVWASWYLYKNRQLYE